MGFGRDVVLAATGRLVTPTGGPTANPRTGCPAGGVLCPTVRGRPVQARSAGRLNITRHDHPLNQNDRGPLDDTKSRALSELGVSVLVHPFGSSLEIAVTVRAVAGATLAGLKPKVYARVVPDDHRIHAFLDSLAAALTPGPTHDPDARAEVELRVRALLHYVRG